MESTNLALEGANVTLENTNVASEGANVTLEDTNLALEGANVTLKGASAALERTDVMVDDPSRRWRRPSCAQLSARRLRHPGRLRHLRRRLRSHFATSPLCHFATSPPSPIPSRSARRAALPAPALLRQEE